jgi:kynurenine formamidase
MMTTVKITAAMLTAFVALALSRPAMLAQATDRHAVRRFANVVILDRGFDVTYATHKVWLATGNWGVELVANLRRVPPVGATVFVGATKVKGATGGPVRLIAVW